MRITELVGKATFTSIQHDGQAWDPNPGHHHAQSEVHKYLFLHTQMSSSSLRTIGSKTIRVEQIQVSRAFTTSRNATMAALRLAVLAIYLGAHLPLTDAVKRLPASAIPPAEWETLNATVNGRLHAARPLASPCYWNVNGTEQRADREHCATVQSNRRNHWFATDQPGAFQSVSSCYTRTRAGCNEVCTDIALAVQLGHLPNKQSRMSTAYGSKWQRYSGSR